MSSVIAQAVEGEGYSPLHANKKAPLPLMRGFSFYTRTGILHCLNLASGEEKYVERLPSACWATPIAGRDHVFFFGKDAVTAVIKAGEKFEELNANRL